MLYTQAEIIILSHTLKLFCFIGTSSRNVPGLLEDGVGATFVYHCHVDQARGEGSNKM